MSADVVQGMARTTLASELPSRAWADAKWSRGEMINNFGAEGNGPSLYFKNPDGNVIEFKGPAVAAAGDA